MTLTKFAKGFVTLLGLFVLCNVSLAQSRTVTGKVTDSKGEPVSSATVTVKGTQTSTTSAADGTFRISVPAGSNTLVISSVGFGTKEMSIAGTDAVSVTLEDVNASLNEVVVVGYGTSRKRDLTGAVSKVGAKDFNKGLQISPDQLIQGKVPGVQVVNNSGAPGGGVTVRIRGNASIRGGNQPLFVVDGIFIDGRQARPGFGGIPDVGNTPGGNPLNFINPNDILSIEVLKDASATAIYGSRGANGVVLITTKRGQSGTPKVELGTSVGFSSILRRPDVLTGDEYRAALTKYNQSGANNLGASVDALDEILQTGVIQNYNASISGGNENGKYRVSLSALDQEGIIRKSGFTKYTAGVNGNFKFLESKKLGVDFNLIVGNTKENVAPVGNNAGFRGSLIGQALQWNPTKPLRKPDGSLNIDQGGDQINPLGMIEAYTDKTNVTTVVGSISPYYKFTKNLEYRILYGINYGTGNRRSAIASFLNLEGLQRTGSSGTALGGLANVGNSILSSQQFTQTLNYTPQISKDLSLGILIGTEYLKSDNSGTNLSGRNFENTSLPYYNYIQFGTQGERRINSFADPTTELQSYFTRVNLNYKDRYLITATVRADGSSKFGSNNRYGVFPSFAAAWNITNEEFFKVSAINNLKLRLGWGITGNQEFPAGSSQERWSASQGGFSRFQLENPDLKWEQSATTNAGVDFTIAQNRISGSVDWFSKVTKNILFARDLADPVPATSSQRWENLDGNILNTGVEVALNANIVRKKDFNLDFGVFASFLKNELRDFAFPIPTGEINGQGLTGAFVQRLISGQPLNVFYVRNFEGIDKTNGQAILTDDGASFFYKGDPNPRTLLGLNLNVTYKKLALEVNMNGAYGFSIYNNTENAVLPINNLGTGRNTTPKAVASGEALSSPITTSSRYLENGNYMRLANATLQYRVGDIGKTFKGVTLFVTGQNLFIITNYSGFDPEVNTDKAIGGVPSFGIEYTPYPTARTVIFGLNFSL
jgi:TonB-dependent starch-binding outer membrane protein SusC